MPRYTVTFEFEADDDQDASNIWGNGYYLEADLKFSWELLQPQPPPAVKKDTE